MRRPAKDLAAHQSCAHLPIDDRPIVLMAHELDIAPAPPVEHGRSGRHRENCTAVSGLWDRRLMACPVLSQKDHLR
eukprot:373751-Pyramimonas_sp.AAC.1